MNALLLFLLRLLTDVGFLPPTHELPVVQRPVIAAGQVAPAAPAPIPEAPGGLTRTRVTADADISNGF